MGQNGILEDISCLWYNLRLAKHCIVMRSILTLGFREFQEISL